LAVIYVLQGKANTGKSLTIEQVFYKLRDKYTPPALIQDWSNPLSLTVIMTGVNGKMVGIESRGDAVKRLKQAVSNFANAGCDLIFLSCRRIGETVECINNFIEHNIKFIQQDTAPPDQHNHHNLKMALHLIELAGL
jgi:hypothetical protein